MGNKHCSVSTHTTFAKSIVTSVKLMFTFVKLMFTVGRFLSVG